MTNRSSSSNTTFVTDIDKRMSQTRTVLLILCVGYFCLFWLALFLLYYWSHLLRSSGARKTARKVVLPSFRPLLWILALVSLAKAMYLGYDAFTLPLNFLFTRTRVELYNAGRNFLLCLTPVFLCQRDVDHVAITRAVLLSLVLSVYDVPIVWIVCTFWPHNHVVAHWIPFCTRLLVTLFYVGLIVAPPNRASKETLCHYACQALLAYSLLAAYTQLIADGHLTAGHIILFLHVFCEALLPIFIWRLFKADTEHWRAVGHRCLILQHQSRMNTNNKRRSTSEMHLTMELCPEQIIDFSHIIRQEKLFDESMGTMYNGILYGSTSVQIKAFRPIDFKDETISYFSHEAAIFAGLRHPNVAKFYGLSVCPPYIYFIMERHQCSLHQMIMSETKIKEADSKRQRLLLNLCYMIDAARCIAFLHSFSPPFVNGELNPSKFFVSMDNRIILADLGISRTLNQDHVGISSHDQNISERAFAFLKALFLSESNYSDHLFSKLIQNQDEPSPTDLFIEYIAPEILAAKSWANNSPREADIFSLGMIMWAISHPSVHALISDSMPHLQQVAKGHRAEISPTVPPRLKQLIQKCWDTNAAQRPNAGQVVRELESIQKNILSPVAMGLMDSMMLPQCENKENTSNEEYTAGKRIINRHNAKNGHRSGKESGFAASGLIKKMMQLDFVNSTEEAIRLGNAFMMCGFLHHRHHMLSFEYSMEPFHFDRENLQEFYRIWCTGRELDTNRSVKDSPNRSEVSCGKARTNKDIPKHENYGIQYIEFCKCRELSIYGAEILTEISEQLKSPYIDIACEDAGLKGAGSVQSNELEVPVLHEIYTSTQTPTERASWGRNRLKLCSK